MKEFAPFQEDYGELYFIFVSHEGELNVTPHQTPTDKKRGVFSNKRTIKKAGERVIFLKEKHAFILSGKMKEYLGAIELTDMSILDKTADEIRDMNLPKPMPKDRRKTVLTKQGEVDYAQAGIKSR